MIRIFQAGFFTACLQGIFVVAITYAFMLAASRATAIPEAPLNHQGSLAFAEWMESHSILLRYNYFLIAIGLVLTRNRFVDLTAENIQRHSVWLQPIAPRRELETIFGQLLIATICFGIATLQSPPSIVLTISNLFSSSWFASVIWSGTMSIVLAAFGATVVAAKKAM
jgi:hypothetical protein